ncbi:MAG: leucine-rich repeat domain-containing protein [Acutalibacteraceae bacterium]
MTAMKKPLSVLMAILLVFTFIAAVPVTVFAADDEEVVLSQEEIELNKKVDGDYEYVITNGGSETMLIKYTGTDSKVTLPSKLGGLSLTAVGDGAFAGNTTVEEVKLDNSILTLGNEVFKGCTALKEIKNTGSLTTMGEGVFEDCTALEKIVFPEAVTEVSARLFKGCTSLTEIKPHKNLKGAAPDAFEGTPWEDAQADGPLVFGRILYGAKGSVADVVVPKGVSIIEDYVYLGHDEVKTLTLGEDVEDIGLYAFQDCVNLETVNVDEAIGVIYEGAFKGCTSLKSIDFSESTLATISYAAFMDCTSLKEVKLPETIYTVGDYAFANTAICEIEFFKNVNTIGVNTFSGSKQLSSINVASKNKEYSSNDGVLYNKKGNTLITMPAGKTGSFQIPEGVQEIGAYAFSGSALTEVTLPENSSLNKIGAKAFMNSAIESIEIAGAVEKINADTFKNAVKLSSVVFKCNTAAEGEEEILPALTYIGTSAFEGCSALTEIELPSSLHDIAASAFKNTGLTTVVTGDGLKNIGSYAFADNKNLKSLTLGENVATIGDYAFANCSKLGALVLPASVVDFNGTVFAGCTGITKLALAEGNKAYKAVGATIYSADGKSLVVAGNSKTQSIIIANGTEVIEAGAFDMCQNLVTISAPATLTVIKGNALDGTKWYKNGKSVLYVGKVLYKVKGTMPTLSVQDGTVAIADGAAANNKSVVSVKLPGSLKYIGDNAFEGVSVTKLVIPQDVTYIGANAFKDASKLKKVSMPKAPEALGCGAFSGCEALTEILVPVSVKVIASDTFAGCKALKNVQILGAEKINKFAFSGCENLETFTVSASTTEIDAMAFDGCTALTSFSVEDGNTVYSSKDGVILSANDEGVFNTIALYPAGKAGEYTVADGIEYIEAGAFYNCDALTGIVFSNSVKEIKEEAFFDCDGITTVNIPENVKKIGSLAFASCNELREFVVNSNLTDYEDNTFDGCYYMDYDGVTISVADGSSSVLFVVIAVFVIIALVAFIVYRKNQKKAEQEIIAKNKEKAEVK